MEPPHGGEVGAVVKDVFDYNVRSALQIAMEGLSLLAERSSNGSVSKIELGKQGGGKGRILRGMRHTASVIDVVVWHVPLPI